MGAVKMHGFLVSTGRAGYLGGASSHLDGASSCTDLVRKASLPPQHGFHDRMLIQDNASLAQVCARLAHDEFVTVDTEFMRDNHLLGQALPGAAGRKGRGRLRSIRWPPGLDLAPLLALMAEPKMSSRSCHASRQDLEISWHLHGTPSSLARWSIRRSQPWCWAMAKRSATRRWSTELTRAKVDKTSQRFSDWSHRPLDRTRWTKYALGDVILPAAKSTSY